MTDRDDKWQMIYDAAVARAETAEARIRDLESREAVLTDVQRDLHNALVDIRAGWRYIRLNFGDLAGVGWERCAKSSDAALDKSTAAQTSLPTAAASLRSRLETAEAENAELRRKLSECAGGYRI